jgi:hypothetical protein
MATERGLAFSLRNEGSSGNRSTLNQTKFNQNEKNTINYRHAGRRVSFDGQRSSSRMLSASVELLVLSNLLLLRL